MKRAKHPGYGRTGEVERTVYVTYGPEEFFALWGGTPDDYRDFLAARQEELARERDDLRLFWPVRVPFDVEDFSAWAKENPEGAALPDAHARWAQWVAAQPERLRNLYLRHPYEYQVPRDEILKVEVLVWCLALELPAPEAAKLLAMPLPPGLLHPLHHRPVGRGTGGGDKAGGAPASQGRTADPAPAAGEVGPDSHFW